MDKVRIGVIGAGAISEAHIGAYLTRKDVELVAVADQVAERTGSTRDEVLASTHAKPPLGRMGTEDEIAAVIAFLCS